MVDVKTVVVSVVAVLSVSLQHGIRAQPTIGTSFVDDSCSQLEEELDFKVVEHIRLRSALENKQQKIETLEIASNSQAEEIRRLNLELENKQQKIEIQENVSSTQVEENRRLKMELENKQRLIASLRNVSNAQTKEKNRLNMDLENKQQLIATLRNVSSSHMKENERLNMELEHKQQLIAILRNSSSAQTVENHRLKMELESINQINQIKQQLIVALRNESSPQMKENQQLNMELEHKQQLIALMRNYSSAQTKQNYQLHVELENKQHLIATLRNMSSNHTKENQRLNLELKTKQQMIETLQNVSNSQSLENQRLKLESERHRLRTQPATATFVGTLDTLGFEIGMTKVEDRIYVLEYFKSRVHVYQDGNDFRFIREIALNSRTEPYDIVYSNKSKCVYISDDIGKCIWAMATTGMDRLTKWLTNVNDQYTLSLSIEGHLLVLRHQPSSQLDIYSLNATLIRKLQLPQDVKKPNHVVQTLDGNFIISHQLNNASSEQLAISKVTNDGQLMYRFYSRDQSDKLNVSAYLCLDIKNNRLFVADYNNHRVILFDASALTWIRVLLSREMNGIFKPFRLFYDESKKHLFVAQYDFNVTVYEIN